MWVNLSLSSWSPGSGVLSLTLVYEVTSRSVLVCAFFFSWVRLRIVDVAFGKCRFDNPTNEDGRKGGYGAIGNGEGFGETDIFEAWRDALTKECDLAGWTTNDRFPHML